MDYLHRRYCKFAYVAASFLNSSNSSRTSVLLTEGDVETAAVLVHVSTLATGLSTWSVEFAHVYVMFICTYVYIYVLCLFCDYVGMLLAGRELIVGCCLILYIFQPLFNVVVFLVLCAAFAQRL